MLPVLVVTGMIFDLLSLRALVLTLIDKKFKPGIPVIGLVCYMIFFLMAFTDSLDAGSFNNPYLMFASGLIAAHLLLHGALFYCKRKFS